MGKILVSAGHSTVAPLDPGASGNGFIEAQEALKIRDKVTKILCDRGADVIADGADGESQPLKKAIELAKTASIAVEIHFNAGPAAATGIEVLAKANNKAIAQKLAAAVENATCLPLRGEKGWKLDDSGQHHRLGFCEAGGIIIEVCFISNKNDMAAYQTGFEQLAINLADALFHT